MKLPGAAVAVISVGLTGCFFGDDSCDKVEEYETSAEIAPLEVPADLDEPGHTGVFVIPPERVAQEEPSPGSPDEPPPEEEPP